MNDLSQFPEDFHGFETPPKGQQRDFTGNINPTNTTGNTIFFLFLKESVNTYGDPSNYQ